MIMLSLLLWLASSSLPSLSFFLFSLSNHFPTRECHNECGTFSTSLSEWPVKAARHCATEGEELGDGKGVRLRVKVEHEFACQACISNIKNQGVDLCRRANELS